MLKPSWTNSYPDKQRKAVFNSESWGGGGGGELYKRFPPHFRERAEGN